MLVEGVIFLPSGNSIYNKLFVSVTLVRPPSNVKYGALPSISLDVCAVNACTPCVYDNNNNGAKNNADLDNNGGLDNLLDIGGKDPDDGVDFATQNDFDDENNCGALF
ncbi:hypothetical protein [Gilliamella sp. Gris1-4]|uniref:hypothetical protein n=1 Tax=Gilliamella sp. Gris1-4 TaxID=3120244 RepID=UPI00080D9897|nr:hypothetical protein [Gilliamella apicola]OCG34073.1 hypothetical protein A9G31_11205 [Gilliamella apicola]OCG66096.1 hypothetical protein A9G39_06925 [Gilliamella apicola]